MYYSEFEIYFQTKNAESLNKSLLGKNNFWNLYLFSFVYR